MARTREPGLGDLAVLHQPRRTTLGLDNAGGGYTVFGKVIDGMDVVDAIAKAKTTTKPTPADATTTSRSSRS